MSVVPGVIAANLLNTSSPGKACKRKGKRGLVYYGINTREKLAWSFSLYLNSLPRKKKQNKNQKNCWRVVRAEGPVSRWTANLALCRLGDQLVKMCSWRDQGAMDWCITLHVCHARRLVYERIVKSLMKPSILGGRAGGGKALFPHLFPAQWQLPAGGGDGPSPGSAAREKVGHLGEGGIQAFDGPAHPGRSLPLSLDHPCILLDICDWPLFPLWVIPAPWDLGSNWVRSQGAVINNTEITFRH